MLDPIRFVIARLRGRETQWVSAGAGPCEAGYILHVGAWGNRWWFAVALVREGTYFRVTLP